MKTLILVLVIFLNAFVILNGESDNTNKIAIPKNEPWSIRIADTFLARHPGAVTYDSGSPDKKWNYEQGCILEAFNQLWLKTGNKKYFEFIKNNIDHYVEENGSIKTYKYDDFSLDNINTGRQLLTLYLATKNIKYKKAADTLRKQLANQPRTKEGGFWHKKIYPNQMWLDGLYMAEPFYAQYAEIFNEPKDFDDIANQFIFMYNHAYDPKTGLLYHGWDESKEQKWANPKTGSSPTFWSRAMGWYEMGLVDVLDFFPKNNPKREQLIKIFQNVSKAILRFRDKNTNVWFQVTEQGGRKGNYLEASASCMFTYAFAKGANNGYLNKKYLEAAKESFEGIIKNFVSVEDNGFINLNHTCKSAGLGGKPYRDASFEYYITEPQRSNDMKGIAPFINAAIQLEKVK